jgi:hypothetical protein
MSFWEKDYNALFITSFYKNPYMHTAEDTIGNVNQNFLLRVAQALVGMMVNLAKDREPVNPLVMR